MGEPVTTGMMIGAALGGGTSAIKGQNPLKGALIGGALGGIGGGFMGAGSGLGAASGASTAATTAAGGSMTAVPSFGGNAFQIGANAVPSAGIFSGGGTAALGGINPITAAGPSSGMVPSSLADTSFMDTVGGGLKGIGQYAQQNPVLTQMASQTAQQMMRQPEVRMAPAGQVSRSAIQPMDYMSLLNPQQGTVLKPQPISLLG